MHVFFFFFLLILEFKVFTDSFIGPCCAEIEPVLDDLIMIVRVTKLQSRNHRNAILPNAESENQTYRYYRERTE